MKTAKRLQNIKPYLFTQLEQKVAQAKEKGIDIIDLGIGDPVEPTPSFIIDEMKTRLDQEENHRYPSSIGLNAFRQAVATWYKERFGVELSPEEVVSLVGSKEGIAHIALCYTNPGDYNLIPDPAYPVYTGGTTLARGKPYYMPLLKENRFLPKLEDIPSAVAKKARLLYLNYPNNPTGAVVTPNFFQEVVKFAREYDLLVCHDHAYSEIAYDGYLPPSFLQTSGAKEVGIEFNSVSKSHNMTGWRLGWAVGTAEAVKLLGTLKSNLDSGVFQPIQYAGIAALKDSKETVEKMIKIYRRRRDLVVDTLQKKGWGLERPKATIYIWAKTPAGYSSISFTKYAFDRIGVLVTPGNGYGINGEGYFRISLTVPDNRLQEAMSRWEKL